MFIVCIYLSIYRSIYLYIYIFPHRIASSTIFGGRDIIHINHHFIPGQFEPPIPLWKPSWDQFHLILKVIEGKIMEDLQENPIFLMAKTRKFPGYFSTNPMRKCTYLTTWSKSTRRMMNLKFHLPQFEARPQSFQSNCKRGRAACKSGKCPVEISKSATCWPHVAGNCGWSKVMPRVMS